MTSPSVATRIALLHPAVLTATFVMGGFVMGAFVPFVPSLVRALCGTLFVACWCGWSWAVFTVSIGKRSPERVAAWKTWMFVAPPLLVLLASVAGWSMNNSPAALIFFATLFVSLWQAAQALEYAGVPTGRAPTGRVLTTMFLMYFAPVGIWVLRHKIRRAAIAA